MAAASTDAETQPPAQTKRVIITKMVLENFKSYAGEVTIGPFQHCMTSIVGPNGSGKSNVLDALLFVFGRNAKNLRQDNLGQLVHSSAAFPNIASCKVSIHFLDVIDLPDGTYKPIEGSELVLSRIAKKEGKGSSSQYQLDHKNVKLAAVTEQLMKRGIDMSHHRWMILQGEIEAISLMTPKSTTVGGSDGLLEYLCGIIGTDQYEEPIKEASAKVDELIEKHGEVVYATQVKEKALSVLEPMKLLQEAYMEKKNEMHETESVVLQLRIAQEQSNDQKYFHQSQEIEMSLKDLTDEHGAEKKACDELAQQIDELEQKLKVMEKNLLDNESILTKAGMSDTRLKQESKSMKENLKKTKEKIASTQKTIQDKQIEIESKANQSTKSEAEAHKLKDQLDKLKAEMEQAKDSIKEETKELTEQLRVMRDKLSPLQDAAFEVEQQVLLCKSEVDLLLNKKKDAEQAKENTVNEQKETQDQLKALTTERTKADSELAAAKSRVASNTKITEDLKKKAADLSEAVRTSRYSAEEGKAVSNAISSRQKIVTALMEEKRRGNPKFQGVFGQLSELGSIDEKYSDAISIHNSLEFIVVSDPDQAERCVAFARQKSLGIATFLVLSQQKHLEAVMNDPKRPQPPEGAPRLHDQIKVNDPRFRVAFYFAVRDTIVANNLDQATRIAFPKGGKRWRVVTLTGQVIETSGTMTGGGKPGGRVKMGTRIASQEGSANLKELDLAVEKSSAQLQQTQERLKELKTAIDSDKKLIQKLSTQLRKLDVEIEAAKVQLDDLAQRQSKQQHSLSADEIKLLESEQSKLNSLQKKFAPVAEKRDKMAAQVDGLENKVLDVGGVRMKSLKSKIESVNSKYDTAKATANKSKVQSKAAERAVGKGEVSLKKLEEELVEIEESIKKISEERKNIENDVAPLFQAMNGLKEEVKETTEQSSKLVSKRDVSSKKLYQIEEKKVTHESKLKDLKDKSLSTQKLVKTLEKELKTAFEKLDTPKRLTEEELSSLDLLKSIQSLNLLKSEVEQSGSQVNMKAIEEYDKANQEYQESLKVLEQSLMRRDEARKQHDDLRKTRLDTFMNGFQMISTKLKEMYQMITLGGDADLELVDSLDPFSEGIVFSVRPPKKSWKNITNLSGGEKTLSSLALVFALHHYKPAPLYVMDEIDAALDFRNVSIVANYIKERTKNAQFIIISLRTHMFELADHLVGVYKTADCSKSVTIDPKTIALG